jgi:hypothetical protein
LTRASARAPSGPRVTLTGLLARGGMAGSYV